MSFFKSEYQVKVSFEDLDPMNIVWHGNYMRYLEQARCDMFSKLNYSYKDIGQDNIGYPIAKMNVKYIKPAEFEDVLVIKSEITAIEPSLNIKYEIFNKNTNTKIFEATTMQIAINIKTKESIYTPPKKFVEAIKKYAV